MGDVGGLGYSTGPVGPEDDLIFLISNWRCDRAFKSVTSSPPSTKNRTEVIHPSSTLGISFKLFFIALSLTTLVNSTTK